MTDPARGIVTGVTAKSRSRREVEITTGVVGTVRLTLAPGVLGTDDGAQVIARASDLRAVAYQEPRRSARDRRMEG